MVIGKVFEDNAVPIHHANEIFDATTGKWKLGDYAHYILMNDIELSNVTPITTPIGSFDGNNRVIKIKSFAIDPSSTLFGLFASIGTYTEKDGSTHQTILKNMIVILLEYVKLFIKLKRCFL